MKFLTTSEAAALCAEHGMPCIRNLLTCVRCVRSPDNAKIRLYVREDVEALIDMRLRKRLDECSGALQTQYYQQIQQQQEQE